MLNKIKNLIKRAMVISTDDTGDYQLGKVTYHDRICTVEVATHYGHYYNPPENALGFVLNIGADESNRFGFFDTPTLRFQTVPGEVANGNPISRCVTYYRNNGDIDITATKDMNVTITGDCNVTINGNAVVNVVSCTVNASESIQLVSPSITMTNSLMMAAVTDSLVKLTQLIQWANSHYHEGDPSNKVSAIPLTQAAGTTTVKAN